MPRRLLAWGSNTPAARLSRSGVIARLKNIAFGSQVKIVATLAGPACLIIFLIFLAMSAAGAPIGGDDDGPLSDLTVAAIFAAGIALLQIAALGLLRLLPWPGPRLKIEGQAEEDRLRNVFE